MTETDAKTEARARDLKAPGGVWFKARQRGENWVVVRVSGDKERVVTK